MKHLSEKFSFNKIRIFPDERNLILRGTRECWYWQKYNFTYNHTHIRNTDPYLDTGS